MSEKSLPELLALRQTIIDQQENLRRMSGVLEQIIGSVLTAYALHLTAYNDSFNGLGSVSSSDKDIH